VKSKLAVIRPENQALQEWEKVLDLQIRAGEVSKTTGYTYLRGMSKFYEWLLSNQVDQVTPETITLWKADMLEGSKPGSVNTWLAGVKRFFEWAAGAGLLDANPAAGVKNVTRRGTTKRHERQALTDREIMRVLSQPDRSTDQGKRDYAILALMAYCALREVEIHRADLADLSTVGNYQVLQVQGKGSTEKDDVAVIAALQAQDALDDWLMVRGRKPGALFVSLSDRSAGSRMSTRAIRDLVKYLRAAGVVDPRKTLHSLRHSAATNAIRHGAPLQKVQSLLRHASIDTTMIYFHETDRLDNPGEQFINYQNGNGEG
jgi:integrase/recombinase XerD